VVRQQSNQVRSQRSFHIPRSSFKAILLLVIAGSLTFISSRVTAANLPSGFTEELQQFGIANPLPDPRLELHNAHGALLASNDNWQSDAGQAALITGYGLARPNSLESAVAISLAPGPYTAIVTGKNNQTGIGLIEIYDEQ
jgi:hypothetical protein